MITSHITHILYGCAGLHYVSLPELNVPGMANQPVVVVDVVLNTLH